MISVNIICTMVILWFIAYVSKQPDTPVKNEAEEALRKLVSETDKFYAALRDKDTDFERVQAIDEVIKSTIGEINLNQN